MADGSPRPWFRAQSSERRQARGAASRPNTFGPTTNSIVSRKPPAAQRGIPQSYRKHGPVDGRREETARLLSPHKPNSGRRIRERGYGRVFYALGRPAAASGAPGLEIRDERLAVHEKSAELLESHD